MAVNFSNSLKTARQQAIVTALGSGGSIRVGTTGMGTTLVSFSLNSTPGTVSGSVLTFSPTSSTATASASGTAAVAEIRAADGTTVVVSGLTVGTSSADLLINATAISSGQTITLNSATISHN